jgi:SAM-dependent methyltransferase
MTVNVPSSSAFCRLNDEKLVVSLPSSISQIDRRLLLPPDDNDDDNKDIINNHYHHHRRRFLLTMNSSCLLLISGFTTNQIAYASTTSKTGILLPSVGEIEASIPSTWDEENDNPLYNRDIKSAFSRLDNTPDTLFYTEPRFVEHVDENAVKTMTSYISTRLLHSGDSVLDLCSSWTSHIDQQQQPQQQQGGGVGETLNLKRVAGLGMNAKELKANTNNIKLPYTDSSFDIVLLQLSIDYLISPLEVLKESSRVLKPNGRIAILFSNRLFLTKAVGLWTGSDDIEHAYTVGGYLHFCGGGFTNIMAEDLSMRQQKGRERVIVGDPLYVVTATKGGLI